MDLLINITISASVTALLILLAKFICKDRFTPKWHMLIWIILAVRLAMPYLPESNFSIQNFIPTMESTTIIDDAASRQGEAGNSANINQTVGAFIGNQNIDTGDMANLQGGLGTAFSGEIAFIKPFSGDAATQKVLITESTFWTMLGIWITGALLLSAYFCGAYAHLYRKLRQLPDCMDLEILLLLENCKRGLNIKNKIIQIKTGAKTPMLAGILKPTVYFSDDYSLEELEYVLMHELCHYKSKDILINVLATALLCAYWYNPILWVCFFVLRKDMEIYCDERAIKTTGNKRAYATVLLKTATARNAFVFATTSLQNGEKEVSQRIKKIAMLKQPKVWVSALAITLAVAVGVVCLTNGIGPNTETETISIDADGRYLINVPSGWADNMAHGEDLYYNEFTNKEGITFAGTMPYGMDLTQYMQPSALRQQGTPYGGAVDYESQIKYVAYDAEETPYFKIEERTDLSNNGFKTYLAYEGTKTGIEPKTLEEYKKVSVFIIPEEYSATCFSIWKMVDDTAEVDLMKIASTFRQAEDPTQFRVSIESNNTWVDDASALLELYVDHYVNADVAPADKIESYRARTLGAEGYHNGINAPSTTDTNFVGEQVYKDQDVPWDIIYDAVIYQVGFELAPAGGDMQEISRPVLFTKSLDENGASRTYMLFIDDANIAQYGFGYAALKVLNEWYETQILPQVYEACRTPYIGNNSADGKIIQRLPLSKYTSGLELQTQKEPYGIIVNYDLGNTEDYGESSLLYQKASASNPKLNPYLQDQLYKNAVWLLSCIDNAGVAEMRIDSVGSDGALNIYSESVYREDTILWTPIEDDGSSQTTHPIGNADKGISDEETSKLGTTGQTNGANIQKRSNTNQLTAGSSGDIVILSLEDLERRASQTAWLGAGESEQQESQTGLNTEESE